MQFDESYMQVAKEVLDELDRYKGYSYASRFQSPKDISRLAVAIERAVEHRLAGNVCAHEEQCKGIEYVDGHYQEGK